MVGTVEDWSAPVSLHVHSREIGKYQFYYDRGRAYEYQLSHNHDVPSQLPLSSSHVTRSYSRSNDLANHSELLRERHVINMNISKPSAIVRLVAFTAAGAPSVS